MSEIHEFLGLVPSSGPFLSPKVLEESLSQGVMDGVSSHSKILLRSIYEEWSESIEDEVDNFAQIHEEFIVHVLEYVLDIREQDIIKKNEIKEEWSYSVPELGVTYKPDLAFKSNSGELLLPITIFPANTNLEKEVFTDQWAVSPLEKMIHLCHSCDVRIGLVTDGERWMLVNAPSGATSGHASWYSRLWFQEPITLRAFQTLLNLRRFYGPKENTLPSLLERSEEFQEDVTNTLGDQVRSAVEILLQALGRADQDRNGELLNEIEPTDLYEAGLTVMMRLVFLLCAEERDLLLLGNREYDENYAVSTLRAKLQDDARSSGEEILERRWDAWSRLISLFRAVYGGIEHEELRMPPLGGSLFDPERFPFLEGRPSGSTWKDQGYDPLPIDNGTVLKILKALQVLEQKNGSITLSYQTLDVEQIGHVYEGLLENTVTKLETVTLGIKGTKKVRNPIIALEELEDLVTQGNAKLNKYFRELTGRPGTDKWASNSINRECSEETYHSLLKVCHDDSSLADRIKPFQALLRTDAWDNLLVYQKGSYAVVAGKGRRDTGSHYTPKYLTERIVNSTLEPAAFIGPAEGLPREEWTLKSSEELLDLKICDPAMGSGAFLVECCRWLSKRLVESWGKAELDGKQILLSGIPVSEINQKEIMSKGIEDRSIQARRLVAERCLYGVDINPMAVELAKLSLWLVTLCKGRPFGFLDHNLKSGDSLLGITEKSDLINLGQSVGSGSQRMGMFDLTETVEQKFEKAIDASLELRKKLRSIRVLDITDVQKAKELDQKAAAILEFPKLVGDAICSIRLQFGKRPRDVARELNDLSAVVDFCDFQDKNNWGELQGLADRGLGFDLPEHGVIRRPFHWIIEYPEVFLCENSGFDAIVGNPPYIGGRKISSSMGKVYQHYISTKLSDIVNGNADLVAYFFLRSHKLSRVPSSFGLLAVNTIVEGDTKQVGLEQILDSKTVIFEAWPDEAWRGCAAVVTSCVHMFKGEWSGQFTLKGKAVERITENLSENTFWSPKPLAVNKNQSFQGSLILGDGFIIEKNVAEKFLKNNPSLENALFPYLNGQDLNNQPDQQASRWVINFWDWPLDRKQKGEWEKLDRENRAEMIKKGSVTEDYPGNTASDFPELLLHLEENLKPEREEKSNQPSYRKIMSMWWKYWRSRSELYHSIGFGENYFSHKDILPSDQRDYVLAISRHSKYLNFSLVPKKQVFSDAMVVFAEKSMKDTVVLISNLHVEWSWLNGSRMKRDLRYTPSDCFETFPFPDPGENDQSMQNYSSIYFKKREEIMTSCQIGVTKLYNKFHQKEELGGDIIELRELHQNIDNEVLKAYGWGDIDLSHGFYDVDYLPDNDRVRYSISKEARVEVMNRLSNLNRLRYLKEQSVFGDGQ